MRIKKNFFAPLSLGLGATRRAAILLLVMMLTTATAWAQIESGSCGNYLTWKLNYNTLTISGSGAMYDYDEYINPAPWSSYADQIQEVVIGDGVTSIGKYAFSSCYNLESVTFAEGSHLTSIGNCAFSGTLLTSIEIPASVTSIGNYAFVATGLTSIEIPASVTSIGNGAFSDTDLTSITIPASVTSIGVDAFSGCDNLESVTFAEGSQLESIGESAFSDCTGLGSITIPASVTSIGSNVFQNCDNLASITVADGNTVYDSRNGCNAIIVKATNTLIIGCKNSTIPASVTSIGAWAFYTTDLTSIEIPASVTSIGMRAFGICLYLATVTVYAPSCSLGEDAFLNCNNLANIYVFSNKVASYQAAKNWKDYAEKITAIPTVTTSYVDASGTLHDGVKAVPLNNAMTTLPAGTYVVNSDVAYMGKITLGGDVNIILADGKTMSVTNTGTGNKDFAIYGVSGSLHIYGQSQGTGALTATANSSVAIKVDDYITIDGGIVNTTSTGDVGIYGIDGVTINGGTVNANGIYADGDITINGGKVTDNSDPGICSYSGTIILGLRNATDYITAESYKSAVKVADGQTFHNGSEPLSGTVTDKTKLNGKTLTPPTYSVTANRATKEDTEYWSTFYHPAAGYTADENTTVYQAAVNTTTNMVELTAVPGREIPADKAVVLKSTQSAITLSRATTTQTLDGNELKGGSTVADGTVPYTLAAKGGTVGFYKFVGAALNPNKAHLEITAPAQSAPAFFGFEENTTAINEHELHESHELSGAWYSLDGRKLSGKPSVKGIYVRNGRKFIIK